MAAYTPILATLGYVLSRDRMRVLLIHWNTQSEVDMAYGKYKGPGRECERDEDAVAKAGALT